MVDLEAEEQEIQRLQLHYTTLSELLEREQRELDKAEEHLKHAHHAQEIVQRTAQAVQQMAHQRICKVVSSALASVFEDPYEFQIEFERKRGKTEAVLQFVRDGKVISKPQHASGGGVVDIAALALRVACLVLHRPRLAPILVLDEPLKFVSYHYRRKARQMIEALAKEMKIQMIIVTHDEALEAGKIVEL